MSRRTRHHDDELPDNEHRIAASQAAIDAAEEALAAKKTARLEKQHAKMIAAKRAQQEKVVAPLLCLITVLVSALLYVWFGNR
jgi:hypothetical protein